MKTWTPHTYTTGYISAVHTSGQNSSICISHFWSLMASKWQSHDLRTTELHVANCKEFKFPVAYRLFSFTSRKWKKKRYGPNYALTVISHTENHLCQLLRQLLKDLRSRHMNKGLVQDGQIGFSLAFSFFAPFHSHTYSF